MPTSTLDAPPAKKSDEKATANTATSMAAGSESETAAVASGAERPYPRWRRRRFLVDKRYQLQMSLMTVVYVLLPVIAFNIFGAIHSRATLNAISKTSPQLLEGLARQQRFWSLSVLVISGLFLVGVLYVRLLETHKTAGPAYRLSRALEELRAGKLGTTVTLRAGDNLVALCDLINGVAESLRERERAEIDEIERIAARLGAGDREAVSDLRELVKKKRSLIS